MEFGIPYFQVQVEDASPSPVDTAARAEESHSKLFAELGQVRAACDEDVPWLREVVADALSRGTLDEAGLKAAIGESRARHWDSRQLALSLGLPQDEMDVLIAGFVAIDMGFPPRAGAAVVAAKPMVEAIKTMVDVYEKVKREKRKAQTDAKPPTQALVSELESAAAASRLPGVSAEDDEPSFWSWMASGWMLVAAILLVLLGIAIPMFSGVSDVYVMGTVVQSIEHRTQESLYYTTTVAYSPRRTDRTKQARIYTITADLGRHDVGSELRVYYDPDNPQTASFNSASEARDSRTVLVALGGLAAVAWIAARRRYGLA
ncbi:MAG TPA: DUF3592 domain-containing protein [Solirubrobacterales bacterium]